MTNEARVGKGRRWYVATVALALLVVAACAGARQNTADIGSATKTAGATTTTLDATVAAILASYRASWANFIAVVETYPVNPLDPRLAQHDTGIELSAERKAMATLNMKDHYNVGPTDLAPVVTSIVDNSAIIVDCIFDHSFEVDAASGAPVEKPDVGHTLERFEMTRIDGSWYVSNSTRLKSGKTEDTCSPGAV